MKRYLMVALIGFSSASLAQAPDGEAPEVSAEPAATVSQAEKSADDFFEEGITRARQGDFFGGIQALEKAAAQGHLDAMLIASSMLIDGTYYEKGLLWLDKAVATGSPKARLELVRLLLARDPSVERPVEDSVPLLDGLVEEGYPPALYLRASQLEQGAEFYEQDPDRAFQLYRQAAEAGFSPAMERLSRAYRQAELGLPADPAEAEKWEQKKEDALSPPQS